MAELLVFGSFWFWTLVVVELILLFLFVVNDKAISSLISLFVFVLILQGFGSVNFLKIIGDDPLSVFIFLIAYLGAGVVWACIKWTLLSLDNAEEASKFREKWLKTKNLKQADLSVEQKAQLKKDIELECPRVVVSDGRYMNKFVKWMLFWWINILITVFSDFLIRICRNIYHLLQGFLQSITDKIWARYGFDKD